MKALVVATVLALGGCAVVPVTAQFPKIPPALEQPCAQLVQVPGTTKTLSQLLPVVVTNYSLHHSCSAKVDAWQQWYAEQSRIFKGVQ